MLEDRRKIRLHSYIALRLREPEKAAEIDEKIWTEFGADCTVLVSDMSGYTRRTKEQGIIHFLALHRKSLEFSLPVIEAAEGILLASKADNLMCLFEHPIHAIEAAVNLNRETDTYNRKSTPETQIELCIGIAHGKILRTDSDIFGDAVNVAYKLGEDTADPGDILLSDAAYEEVIQVARLRFQFRPREEVRTGGVDIGYYRLIY